MVVLRRPRRQPSRRRKSRPQRLRRGPHRLPRSTATIATDPGTARLARRHGPRDLSPAAPAGLLQRLQRLRLPRQHSSPVGIDDRVLDRRGCRSRDRAVGASSTGRRPPQETGRAGARSGGAKVDAAEDGSGSRRSIGGAIGNLAGAGNGLPRPTRLPKTSAMSKRRGRRRQRGGRWTLLKLEPGNPVMRSRADGAVPDTAADRSPQRPTPAPGVRVTDTPGIVDVPENLADQDSSVGRATG
jgi:hypothetical protein